jgi:hypothetical protein
MRRDMWANGLAVSCLVLLSGCGAAGDADVPGVSTSAPGVSAAANATDLARTATTVVRVVAFNEAPSGCERSTKELGGAPVTVEFEIGSAPSSNDGSSPSPTESPAPEYQMLASATLSDLTPNGADCAAEVSLTYPVAELGTYNYGVDGSSLGQNVDDMSNLTKPVVFGYCFSSEGTSIRVDSPEGWC